MMFKKILVVIFLINSMFTVSGCSPMLTKDQAQKIVKSNIEKDGMGNIKIISVTHKFGEYVVKWERKSNCDGGTEYINDRSGKLKHGVRFIC